MRSVYTKTLFSSLAVLAVSFFLFIIMVRSNAYKAFVSGGAFGGLINEQIEEAERRFIQGGPGGVAEYLNYLARQYPGTKRDFLDSAGRDLLSGASRTDDLAKCDSLLTRFDPFAPVFVRKNSEDGRFILLFQPSPGLMLRNLGYYYLLLLVAVVVLCLSVRHQFALPLNHLTAIVRRFGGGDLKARIHSRRRDELGELGNAFDEMANRIATLVTAERRLLQDISHELRSPIARLNFAVELARTSPHRDAAFARVDKEIARLAELIETLIQVTRAEGDSSARNLLPLSVNELLKEVVDDCEIEAIPRGCRIRLSASRELTLHADRELLRRALDNVMRNAIFHTPERSEIVVELKDSLGGALISVRDQGAGVPEEHLAAIFRPFYRVDDSRTQKTGGVGLGLAIAERAVLVHHGNIWAENSAPGLTVCIELPLRDVRA